jgi:hypothetical protein
LTVSLAGDGKGAVTGSSINWKYTFLVRGVNTTGDDELQLA